MLLLPRQRERAEEQEEVSYWKSTSDMLAALLLIVMLIMMVILINLFDKQNELNDYTSYYEYEHHDWGDPWPGDTTWTGDGDGDGEDDRNDYTGWNGGGGGGGTGAYTYVPVNEHTGDYDYPDPGAGDEEGLDKAAVHVSVRDAETDQLILNEVIDFELYDSDGGLKILNTYYPVKMSYKKLSTTESGNFYAPEKIDLGDYYFTQLTDLKGYDRSQNTRFLVERGYTWNDPYEVTVYVSPSKNVIRLQMNDRQTQNGLEGAQFRIYAAEDVITADGTLRYAKDELADTITTDTNGYAESKELYLGTYVLKESVIPFGYTACMDLAPAQVEKKNGEQLPDLRNLVCDPTEVRLTLTDELNEQESLNGVDYVLRSTNDPTDERTFETRGRGNIQITGLEKNCTYELKQTTFLEGYDTTTRIVDFTVDENGFIEGEARMDLTLSNRILRTEIRTLDRLLRKNAPGHEVVMTDSSGTQVAQWASEDHPHLLTGMQPGTYYLTVDGDAEHMTSIEIHSTAQIQNFSCSVMTAQSWIVIGCAGALLLLVLLILVIGAVRKKRKT